MFSQLDVRMRSLDGMVLTLRFLDIIDGRFDGVFLLPETVLFETLEVAVVVERWATVLLGDRYLWKKPFSSRRCLQVDLNPEGLKLSKGMRVKH